jgi:hypothetical protein
MPLWAGNNSETVRETWLAVHMTFICDATCFDWTASSGVAVDCGEIARQFDIRKTSDSCNTNMATAVETLKAVNTQ